MDQQYLVHKIVLGESLPLLECCDETTQDIILTLNEILLIYGFQPDRNIVIMPGQVDITDLEPMNAFYVEADITLVDFATQNGVTIAELRDINNLPPGELLPPTAGSFTPNEKSSNPHSDPPGSPRSQQSPHPTLRTRSWIYPPQGDPGESMPIIENLYLTSAEVDPDSKPY